MSGIGSNKSKAKGKKWGKNKYNRKLKKQEEMKLSHFMCFQCHEMGHFANGCPNKEKLELKKKRSLNMSNASSAALGVTSPQCAEPKNW